MSETPQFHPEIEKAFVTSGEDIGRVKDIGLAEEVAHTVNERRDNDPYAQISPGKEEQDYRDGQRIEGNLAEKIIKRTVTGVLDEHVSSKVVSVLRSVKPRDGLINRVADGDSFAYVQKNKWSEDANANIDTPLEIEVTDRLGRALEQESNKVAEEYDVLKRAAKHAKESRQKQQH